MKILKPLALLLLVSCGATFAFNKCAHINLEAMRQAIPNAHMPQLIKNREHLETYKDCLDREQELTNMVWTQNQNETIARRAAVATELKEKFNAQTERLNAEKSDLNGNMRVMSPQR
jgi:hypothetical protein